MNDYERIARIIRHLAGNSTAQPDLTELAALADLSPGHFHRLFAQWAGVTPKDFLQCLTLNRVKAALLDGSSVLEAALSAGLSGPSRAHDLCVTLEAASPGEIKSRGAGWNIRGGFAGSPFGTCLIAESPRGICHLSFIEDSERSLESDRLREIWKNAHLRLDDTWAATKAVEIFSKSGERVPLRVLVRGTDFQVRVWRALLAIPAGRLLSYGRLADAVGQPSAARAVGSAVGANEISFLIPCHRVIRETGVIGEYRWGTWRKRAMLGWELANCNTAQGVSAEFSV